MRIRTKRKQVYDRMLALMFAVVLTIGAIPWFESKAEKDTPTKYNVADYQGETSYPQKDGKVFAGWYQDAACTKVYMENTGEAYAKFVDEKVLTVKKQMRVKEANASQTNGVRFLTAIDTLRFSKVVFHVEVPEQEKTYDLEETVAYSSIMVEGAPEPQVASKVFKTDEAQYFVSHSLTGIPLGASGSMFRITPYWYTLDGKKVAGTPAAFTVNEALVAESLFTDSVTINGIQMDSAVSAWDLSAVSNDKIIGTNLTDNQVMWFSKKGREAHISMTVTRTDTLTSGYETQPLAGIVVSDGTNTNYLGVRANNVVYGGGGWIEGVSMGDPLASWNRVRTVSLDFVLRDNQIYLYTDGLFTYQLSLQTILAGAKKNGTYAYGLAMGVYDNKTAQLEFSNIEFTTDKNKIDDYQNARFTRSNSAISAWDLSKVDKKMITGSNLDCEKAMWFAGKGNTALIRFTATRLDDKSAANRESQPMAGIRVFDGSSSGYLGVRASAIVVNGAWDHVIGRDLFATWSNITTADIEIALKDNQFHIYIDKVFVKKVNVSDVVAKAADGADLTLGLVMEASGKTAQMQFSDIFYTTDVSDVNTFLGSDEILIDYGIGLGDDLQYNSELYGMNQSNDVEGADPGVFYVSPEEDKTWGGYYYMYQTGSTRDDNIDIGPINAYAFRCYRSKDLYQWELCGTFDQGYSLMVDWSDWSMDAFWAPEVIRNPADGKYYMYFSAASRPEWGTKVEGLSSSSTWYDRLYLGVAVSDTPVGPFDMCYDTYTVGTATYRIPTINFRTGCNTTYDWAAIDVSPFFDDDGTLYLYFNKHMDSHYQSIKGVWGMKMKSMTEPDYTTVSYLAKPYYTTVPDGTYTMESFDESNIDKNLYRYEWRESDINEAPFMLKHNGKYYLTYASNGFSAKNYSVHQAISDSPLGHFEKLSSTQGNPVLDGSIHGGNTYNYMNGTAHHAIVQNGEEMWIVYHRHNSTKSVDAGMDRCICADRVQFVTNSKGTEVLTANGPSMSLQWLPESVSGYKNLAKSATITISTGSGQEYLMDGILPFYQVAQNRVMSATSDVTVTLKWDEAVSVSSVMIYNAYNKNNAFSEVKNLRFKLTGELAGKYAVIPELEFPARYMSNSIGAYVPCAPAVAEFDTLKITELQFTIPVYGTVNLSEIVVLGSEGKSLTNISDYESFCSAKNDGNVQIDGMLDEDVWAGKRWFSNTYLSNIDGTLPTLKATGFTTSKGIYIASVVKDANMVNDGQHTMLTNSAFDFRIAANNVGDTTTKKAWQTYHIMIDMRGDCHCDGASNFKRAVTVEGTTATVEIFIPWEYLGVDTAKGIPNEFQMFPSYRAMLPGTTKITNIEWALGVTTEDVNKYWKFDSTGYQSGDWKGALLGDSITGLTKSGVWDVSREQENMVESCAGATEHTIFFRYMYGSDFVAEATLLPKGTLGSGTPQGGFCFIDTAGNTHTMLLDMKEYPNGVTLTVVKYGNTYQYYADGKALKTETVDTLDVAVFPALHAKNADILFKDYSCKKSMGLFAQQVVVNGATVESSANNWDTRQLYNGIVTGSYAMGSSLKPLYFAQTGNTMLLQTTIRYTTVFESGKSYQSDPLGGIYVHDGTNTGYFGVRQHGVVYSFNNEQKWISNAWPYSVLAKWEPAHLKVQVDIALKDGVFYIYVDGLYSTTLNLSTFMTSTASDAQLAFGLTMHADRTCDLQFSDIKFTTDADKVEAFLAEKASAQ